MLPRLRLPMLALATILSLNGCAATEEEDDSMEAEGATRVRPDFIGPEREQILSVYPGKKLYAKFLDVPGRDWEIIESAPWLAPLPKPVATFRTELGRRFRIFEWDSRKLTGEPLYGVTFRQIDTATKKPVLDEQRGYVIADAIVVAGDNKTITVTSDMPAQTIPVPSGWVLEIKYPETEPGYGWKLQMEEGRPPVDPAVVTEFDGFESAEKNYSKAASFRVRTATSSLHTPTTFRFVSVPLPPLNANAPQGRELEFKATVYRGKEIRS